MKNPYRLRGIMALGVAFVLISMASFVIAAPPGTQPPSSHPPQEISFPDIEVQNLEVDHLSPRPGDIVFLKGTYLVTGCIKKTVFR